MSKYLDLSNFNYEKEDLFGHYCEIEMKFYGSDGNQNHLFKIVGQLKSNTYYDVPLNTHTQPKYIHKKIVPILNVIHCGIAEDEVIRVALKDVKIIKRKDFIYE